MRELISLFLLTVGSAFMLLSAVGLVRLPDLYLRMSASTKTATLGIACVLLAAAIHFNELGTSSRAIATIFFLLLTAPVAAHMMGRAAYFNGVPLWKGSKYNELEGRFNPETHAVAGIDSFDSSKDKDQAS